MKVLLLSPVPPPAGGIATWTKRFLDSKVVKNNIVVTLIDTSVQGKRQKNLSDKKILEEIKRTTSLIKQLNIKLRQEHYDIVHINTSCSKLGLIRDYIFSKLIKKYKLKLVLHCHCDTTYMVNSFISNYFLKRICNIADVILVLNNVSRIHIENISTTKVQLIPNFINEEEILSYDKNINKELKEIVYVGHVVKLKGCEEIIKIATYFPKITFKLIGSISKDFEMIDTPQNVILTGELNRQKVIEEIKQADLFLFPTYTEGFPNVILEAMGNGLPIISTPVGAISDIIEDKGGILVEAGDVEGIIKGLKKLESKDIRESMSQWNYQKVKSTYLTDKVMESLINIYREII